MKPLPVPETGLGDKMPAYLIGMALTLTLVLALRWYMAFMSIEANRDRAVPLTTEAAKPETQAAIVQQRDPQE